MNVSTAGPLSPAPLDEVLAALAHPVRRAMVEQLMHGERTVGQLAAPFDLAKPTVSRHLRVLEQARLLERRVSGREHRCRLDAHGLAAVSGWVRAHEQFWQGSLDRLDRLLADGRDHE